MITITLTKGEAEGLKAFLANLIGKGSLNTTPSWARNLIGKINRASSDSNHLQV